MQKILKAHRKIGFQPFKKSGESDFYLNDIDFIWKKPYFLPISEINRLRREILEKLIQERIKNYTMEAQAPVKTTQFPKETGDYRLNVHNAEAKDFYKNAGVIYLNTQWNQA